MWGSLTPSRPGRASEEPRRQTGAGALRGRGGVSPPPGRARDSKEPRRQTGTGAVSTRPQRWGGRLARRTGSRGREHASPVLGWPAGPPHTLAKPAPAPLVPVTRLF